MSDQNIGTNKSKNKRKNSAKDADVTCWNCFTSENYDNDLEPMTLPKIRQENREKLKVYSFLASELSKPKTVPLKQKVSEHYSVGKKIDETLSKKQANVQELSRHMEENCEKDESEKSSILEKNKSENKSVDKTEPFFVNEEIKDNSVPNDGTDESSSLNLSRKDSLTKVILEPPFSFSNAQQCLKTESNSNQVNISNISEKNYSDILPIHTNSENLVIDRQSENLIVNKDSKVENKSTLASLLKKDKMVAETSQQFKSDKTSKRSNIPIRSPKLLPKTEKNAFIVTNIPVLQRQTSPKYSPVKFLGDKAKDQLVRKTSNTLDKKLPEEKISTFLNNSKETNKSVNEVFVKINKDKSTINMLKSETSLTGNKSSEVNPNDQDDNINILHRVQIKTSTPKDKENQKSFFLRETSMPLVETKEESDMKKVSCDKTDNSSSNCSESGYAGSSSTVQDFCVNENIIKSEALDTKNEETALNNQNVSGIKSINSSLPFLDSYNKKQFLTSTTSLFGNEQAKSKRWSTLPAGARSVSFEGINYYTINNILYIYLYYK